MVDVARNGRSEEQVLGAMAGHVQSGLAVTLGGETRYIRPLTINQERTWRDSVSKMASRAEKAVEAIGADDASSGLSAVLESDLDDVVALVLEFDALRSGSLDREWLENNASGQEIRDTLEVLLGSVYPSMPGGMAPARLLVSLIVAGAAARSARASSTNASSPGTRGSTGLRASKKR